MPSTRIGEWLTQKFLAWQTDQKEIKTLAEFADYLEVGRPALSMWISGKRQPNEKMARRLAQKLGLEIYDVLGMARPDEQTQDLVHAFGKLDPDRQDQLIKRAQELLSEQNKESLQDSSTQERHLRTKPSES